MNSRILLVEDEPGVILTLADLLAAEGYDVDTAMDGPTGLAKAAGGKFGLIILDVMLPGKSGFEVIKELRPAGPHEYGCSHADGQDASCGPSGRTETRRGRLSWPNPSIRPNFWHTSGSP